MKKLLLFFCLICGGISSSNAQAPSIGALVKAIQLTTPSNSQPIANMLDAFGYDYRFRFEQQSYYGGTDVTWVYSKNCKVIHEEYTSGLEYTPSPETADASIIVIRANSGLISSISVQVYSNAAFKTWIGQLKTLGYHSTADGGSGNRGRDWTYTAYDKPTISIWNDYTNTYVLTIR